MMKSTHGVGAAGRLSLLSEAQLRQLDAVALEILATAGVAMSSAKAHAALVAAGARADGAVACRVRLS
jgi:trimethylamine:corrinoid methyltransferase-like protein